DPHAAVRFLREARIQARLDHPAIVPVYEHGHDGKGRPYFTMKPLAGVTLETVLSSGERTLQQLLRAFVDVCNAIEFAHARGVVHRDLKPANIMLGHFGEVHVIDWGVALADEDAPEPPEVIVGTPGYMSPEQLHGELVTSAADVYALGAMLFEIL